MQTPLLYTSKFSWNIKKIEKYIWEIWSRFYQLKCSLKSLKKVYSFRKFNVDIFGKKTLEKIQNLAWDIQKIVSIICKIKIILPLKNNSKNKFPK